MHYRLVVTSHEGAKKSKGGDSHRATVTIGTRAAVSSRGNLHGLVEAFLINRRKQRLDSGAVGATLWGFLKIVNEPAICDDMKSSTN